LFGSLSPSFWGFTPQGELPACNPLDYPIFDGKVLDTGPDASRPARHSPEVRPTVDAKTRQWRHAVESGNPVKVREVIQLLKADGWYLADQRGSHRQFRHPRKPGKVTVAGRAGKDVPTGTLKSIFRQAQIEEKPP
jgi:predicted RNA binding protein YcfA (HicA-like mRNA interferase family)